MAESLASIDFEDFEPGLAGTKFIREKEILRRDLVNHPLFGIEELHMNGGVDTSLDSDKARIAAVVKGKLAVRGNSVAVSLSPGQFCLVPAEVESASLRAESDCVLLVATAG